MISPRWNISTPKLQITTINDQSAKLRGRNCFNLPHVGCFQEDIVKCSVFAWSPRYFCQEVANNCWVSDRNLKLVLPGQTDLSLSLLDRIWQFSAKLGNILIERLDSCDICVSDMIHMTSWCKWGINNLSDWMCDGPLLLPPSSLSIKCLPQNKTESLEFYDVPSFLVGAGGWGWIVKKNKALQWRA